MANQKVTKEKKTGTVKTGAKNSRQGSREKPAGSAAQTSQKSGAKNTGTGKKSGADTSAKKYAAEDRISDSMKDEITLAVTLLVSILFFLSYINLCGTVGKWLNYAVFGLIGIFAYLFPFLLFFLVAFGIANKRNRVARRKILSLLGVFLCIAALFELANGFEPETKWYEYFTLSAELKNGGGIAGGVLVKLLCPLFDTVATAVILVALMIICLMLLTGKELFAYIKKRTNETMKGHRISAGERAQRRLERESEEYEEAVERRPARIITFQKSERDGSTKVEASDKSNPGPKEPIRFVDALKARGGKSSAARNSTSVEHETEINENGIEMEEIIPQEGMEGKKESLMDRISISGEYQKEEDSFRYEEELKRKFGNAAAQTDGDAKLPEPSAAEDIVRMQQVRPETEEEKQEQLFRETERALQESISELSGLEERNAETERKAFIPQPGIPDAIAGDTEPLEPFSASGGQGFSAGDGADMDSVQEKTDAGEREHVHKLSSYRKTGQGTAAQKAVASGINGNGDGVTGEEIAKQIEQAVVEKKYEFPPISLLAPPKPGRGANERELKETAVKLQKTLESFGVRVTVTNISCGPTVTQYELQPEQGVKVSQITKLTDDIKLNMAAADIRIEAPIPGKAAVGIEIPNKENTAVVLRELLESQEFKEHKSKLAFAVGKNISGQTVVSDIAKMPHMLIAGATGSGKSVCINTIIMSILYKADPADVRLIMVDPKVVELSVYNGIPHLLIPVVTDPKKASAALNWAVMEMTDRYNKFAQLGVRDLAGYNEKITSVEEKDPKYPKLPQIVIIVDELADLMMVASGEVEEAICRLAQMARAAGLHLIIATQRPSVNVITGLIKANVPSRIAFAVTSAVDSRTILDGVGAEKLLGKGDMLFFPSGYPKPVRIQGAFVSDSEVSAVVDFLKEQSEGTGYNEEVSQHIISSAAAEGGASSGDRDDYFVEAGKFIIEKEKASIGMLQRVYKIGFNRAARIMDQLTAAGVVGPEEGTKPRKILMTMEEFEQYIETL